MSSRVPRCRTLYSVPDDPGPATAEPALAKLLAGRCSRGHLFFPPQRLGCETCGEHDDQIEIVELEAEGVLRSFALSHREKRPGSEAPLVIGTIALDAGPVFEAVLAVDDDSGLAGGQRVSGRLLPIGENEAGETIVDCFFVPTSFATPDDARGGN